MIKINHLHVTAGLCNRIKPIVGQWMIDNYAFSLWWDAHMYWQNKDGTEYHRPFYGGFNHYFQNELAAYNVGANPWIQTWKFENHPDLTYQDEPRLREAFSRLRPNTYIEKAMCDASVHIRYARKETRSTIELSAMFADAVKQRLAPGKSVYVETDDVNILLKIQNHLKDYEVCSQVFMGIDSGMIHCRNLVGLYRLSHARDLMVLSQGSTYSECAWWLRPKADCEIVVL
jgi:hypothetical protein